MDANVNQNNEAVNSNANVESAPADNQENVQAPPTEGNQSEQGQPEKAVPYERFKQVIDERNQERQVREALESRLKESTSVPQSHSEIDAAVKELVQGGLTEQAAKLLVNNQVRIAQAQSSELKQQLRAYEINEWNRELKEKYKDYAEVSVEADKQFGGLSNEEKAEVVSSKRALHSFFKAVRSDILEKKMNDKFNEGANHAYQNQQMKQGVGNVPGKAPVKRDGALTREAIRNMDPETYRRRLPEINDALSKGLIK